jgi:aminopeptidase N
MQETFKQEGKPLLSRSGYGLAAAAILIITAVAASPGACRPMHHALAVSLFPQDNSLAATDSIYVDPGDLEKGRVDFLFNANLVVENVTSSARISRWYTEEDVDAGTFKTKPDSDDVELVDRAKALFIEFDDIDAGLDKHVIVISYTGVILDSLRAPAKAYARGFGETTGLIEERGIFLTNQSLWYPFQFDRMFTFTLKVDVPWDWMTVSQGRRADEFVSRREDEMCTVARWIEDHPTPELYLVAGKYHRHEVFCDGTWVMTYTYQQSDSLSQVYLDATERYIRMYEHLLGDYPFAKFALVENFWQTGFGMPSFTLLGSKVIRLPFIVHTSYGHEILHNWWGNSVYVDYGKGNWCEGITTYGADYFYKEQAGEETARDYRHQTLMAFSNYVTEGKDFPLSEFRERHDSASQSVGYGKSLMVYHMLRKSLGDSLFWACLREFYSRSKFTIASWDDIETVFSEVSDCDLSWYFDQWVGSKGAPSLRLKDADYEEVRSRPDTHARKPEIEYEVEFTLEQDSLPFVLDVPLRITTADGHEDLKVRLSAQEESYRVRVGAKPLTIAVDPDYDMFRKLYIEEIPITLGTLFGQDSIFAVIGGGEPDSVKAGLRRLAGVWGLGTRVVDESQIAREGLAQSHLWLIGRGSLTDEILNLRPDRISMRGGAAEIGDSEFALTGNTLICTVRNPYDENLGVGIVLTEDLASLLAVAPRVVHYGSYSYLGFAGTRPVLKGVWPERRSPLMVEFR